ncbi:unnamed protein product [Nyctereutes procyonoides]|uniref:Interleukin n=1 Tax=Nyctereutes procyonoides TaxID=34880 RepID=A0A811ZE18_NYCPR|nr:unnamed protein product [Nyctereutes procyonoides]
MRCSINDNLLPSVLFVLTSEHFLTEAGIHVFILGCISAGLPKTDANWQEVILDLERIDNLIQSIHIDTCFLLELGVISFESNNNPIKETVENFIILTNRCKELRNWRKKVLKNFCRVLYILYKCSSTVLDCKSSFPAFLLLTNISHGLKEVKLYAVHIGCTNKFFLTRG